MFVGTLGFFFTLIYLFVRFVPVISIFEVRTLLPEANVHGHQQDFEENVVEIEYTYDKTDPPNRRSGRVRFGRSIRNVGWRLDS